MSDARTLEIADEQRFVDRVFGRVESMRAQSRELAARLTVGPRSAWPAIWSSATHCARPTGAPQPGHRPGRAIEGLRILVQPLEAIDRTPIIDIKPILDGDGDGPDRDAGSLI